MANFYANTVAEFRAAVDSASQLSGAHHIYLKPNATYTFESVYTLAGQTTYNQTFYTSALQIAADITIIGNGATLQPDPNFSEDIRLFTVYLSSRLRLEDVIVRDFHHGYGGVLFLQDISSQESELVDIELIDSQFIANADGNENVVYISNGLRSVTLDNCVFKDNSSNWNGCLFNTNNHSETFIPSFYIYNSQFLNNDSGTQGALYLRSVFDLIIENSSFDNNSCGAFGAALDVTGVDGSTIIRDSTFTNNESGSWGGAIYIPAYHENSKDVIIERCTFFNNKTVYQGGAMRLLGNDKNKLKVIDCIFDANEGEEAAIELYNFANATFETCEFTNNIGGYGSAVRSFCDETEFLGCLFDSNTNSIRGTLYLTDGDVVKIENCIFQNNTSVGTASGEAVIFSTRKITSAHNTFINNYNTVDSSRPIITTHSKSDFRFNDWGTTNGPTVVGQTPTGSGDLIPDYLAYLPFIGVAAAPKHKGSKVNGKDCAVGYASKGSKTTNNPISLEDGEKRLEETDLQVNSPLGVLAFTRRYHQSQQDTQDYMGLGWTHNHSYGLVENGGTPNEIIVTMNGSSIVFEDDNADDIFEASAGSSSVIVKTVSGYDLTASDESVYHFDTAGKLITHSLNNGEVWTYSYDGSNNLSDIADGYGRSLKFAYYSGQIGADAFKNGQLWRVGTHSSSDLSTSPQSPYIELNYTDDGNGDALLTDVQDVRGKVWTYRYYGSEIGETNPKWLNFLVERFSPAVDRDGDDIADSAITLESLSYSGTARDDITSIVQNRGESLINRTLAFDPANDVTTETVEGLVLTHKFTNGVYLGTEDADSNAQEQAPLSNYRPAYQQDAKGNRTGMQWSADGKRLEGVVDANYNETAFLYDEQDRLFYSRDAEGRLTHYDYEGTERQPLQILVTEGKTLVDDSNMSDYAGWRNLGTPSTNERTDVMSFEGEYARHVIANQNEGVRSKNEVEFLADESYVIRARIFVVNSGDSIKMGIAGVTHWDTVSSVDGQWELVEVQYKPTADVSGYLQFTANSSNAEWYVDHVIVDVPQRQQEFVYDSKGRSTSEKLIDPSDGTTVLQETVRVYGTSGNGNGLLESIENKDLLDSSNNSSTVCSYDAQGRVIRTNKTSMFGTCQYNHTIYDAVGNVLGTACGLVTASPIPSDEVGLLALYDANDSQKKHSRITTHEYDEMGRRVVTTSNAGTSWERKNRTLYDALGRVVRTIQNYDEQGSSAPGDWVWNETNAEWHYSSVDSTVISHGTNLDENIISDSEYNGRGLVNLRRDVLGRVTLYGYNSADRLVKTVQNASDDSYDMSYSTGDPDLSAYVASSTVDEDMITEQVYDPNGNVVKSIDARGSVTFTALDVLNRPVKVISNASNPDYDILADLSLENYGAYSTDPDKDMVSTTDYDAMGRVIRSQRLLENRGANDVWDTMLYGYDALGRQVRSIQHASQADYDLSADSSLASYTLSTDTDVDMLTETVYDTQGRVKETLDVNGRVNRMVYDGLNRQVMTVANYVAQVNPPEAWDWTNNQWEDGSANAIAHGDNFDQNIISQTVYDSDGRVEFSRNIEGLVSRNAYDSVGRSLLRVQNFVDNSYVDPAGTVSKDPWNWDAVNGRWQDGDNTVIDRGSNYDQNIISKPDYDEEQRAFQTRDARGNLSRQVYDEAGRTVMSIANYVAQVDGSGNPVPAETWYWDNNVWKGIADVSNLPVTIDHGMDNDQNRISTSEFDLLGRAFRTRDVAGRESYTVYDALGRVVRRIQNYVEQGISIPDDWYWSDTNSRWEYDNNGTLTAIDHGTDNDQNIISETVYNQAGQVVSSRDAFGTESSFVYDSAGRRLQVIQASNTDLATASYTCFDKAGRVLRSIANYKDTGASPDIWDIDGNWAFQADNHGMYRDSNIISEMVYDRASRRVSSVNAVGDVSQTTYFKDGQVDSMTDPEGMVTVYRYDALRRRKMVVQSYVEQGSPVVDPANWAWGGSQYKADGVNDITHGTNNDQNIIVMINYDIAGRMETMRDPRGNLTSYEYDKLGRRIELKNPLDLKWETSYEEVNGAQKTTMRYPGVNGSTVSYPVVREFDRFGRLQGIDYDDDSNTAKVNFDYDILGNRTHMTENDGTSDIRITGYSYDQRNRLTAVDFDTDGTVESVSYDYDMRGLRTKLTMDGNLSIAYSYDAKGRLIGLNDWDNQDSQFNYDALNRHIGTLRPNGMRSVYRLDEVGRLRELRHENKKRQTLAMFRYAVDGRGNRVQAQELTLPANGSATAQVISHENPDILYTGDWDVPESEDFHESSDWDAKMALVFVGDTNVDLLIGQGPDHSIFDIYVDGTLYESVDGYADVASSRTVSIDLKGDDWHGLEIRNRHEQNMQSSGYKVRFASLSVDTALTANVIDYSYDELSRLIQADYNNGTNVYDYGYDVAGNLVDYDGVIRTYNAANQMTHDGTNTLTYDDNGNLTGNGSDTYTWDRANRLSSVGNHSYIYDGLSNRVQQTVNSVVTDYLNDVQPGLTKLLKQDDGTNTDRFVHAPRGIHAVDNGTDWNFYAQDGLGSVRAVVDDSAVVQSSMSFDPYGNVLGGSSPTDFGFTGEQTDADGSVFLRARYYEPQLGIFSALDPWEGIQNRPMSLNGYSWVEGNVPNATDPSGMSCTLGSYNNLVRRGDKLITLARKWNTIPISDCYQLTGIDVFNSCGFPASLATNRCETGLSDEAFAYIMASILHNEQRLRPWQGIGFALYENLGTLYAQVSGSHDSSEGIAQIRPSTARDILRGFIPDPNNEPVLGLTGFDTNRLNETKAQYIEYMIGPLNTSQFSDNSINPFTSIPHPGWEKSGIFEGENMALEDEDIALELLAANIYRGILRAKSGVLSNVRDATVFNLAAWHNEGLQNNYNSKAERYANNVLDHMVQLVEGDCDLGIGRRPAPWLEFKYYNVVDEPHVDSDWAGMRRPESQPR